MLAVPGSRVSAAGATVSVPQAACSPAGAAPRSVTVKPSRTKSAPSGASPRLRSPVQVSPQPAVTVSLKCAVVCCAPIAVVRVSTESGAPSAVIRSYPSTHS